MQDRHEYAHRIHSRRRSKERWSRKLNRNFRADLISQIRKGRAELLQDRPPHRAVYRVILRHRGEFSIYARVVYDTQTCQIVTVLRDTRTVG